MAGPVGLLVTAVLRLGLSNAGVACHRKDMVWFGVYFTFLE